MFSYIGLKRKIEKNYIDMYGITGVGLRLTEKAICLYVDDKTKFIESGFDRMIKTFINKETKNRLIDIAVIIEDSQPPATSTEMLNLMQDVFKMRRRLDSLEEQIESIKNAL